MEYTDSSTVQCSQLLRGYFILSCWKQQARFMRAKHADIWQELVTGWKTQGQHRWSSTWTQNQTSADQTWYRKLTTFRHFYARQSQFTKTILQCLRVELLALYCDWLQGMSDWAETGQLWCKRWKNTQSRVTDNVAYGSRNGTFTAKCMQEDFTNWHSSCKWVLPMQETTRHWACASQECNNIEDLMKYLLQR